MVVGGLRGICRGSGRGRRRGGRRGSGLRALGEREGLAVVVVVVAGGRGEEDAVEVEGEQGGWENRAEFRRGGIPLLEFFNRAVFAMVGVGLIGFGGGRVEEMGVVVDFNGRKFQRHMILAIRNKFNTLLHQ